MTLRMIEFSQRTEVIDEDKKDMPIFIDEEGVWYGVDLFKEFKASVIRNKVIWTTLTGASSGGFLANYFSHNSGHFLLNLSMAVLGGGIAGFYLGKSLDDRTGC